jgi:uncharacterized protein YciI
MKKACFLFTIAILIGQLSFAQNDKTAKAPDPQIRQYWFVLLTKGAHRDQDSATAAKLQMGHLENIGRLYNEGKIKVAGPFGEEGDWQGIFIFDCTTKEEVEKLLQSDPSIAAGRMVYQIKSWYTVPIGSFAPGKPKAPLF